MARGIAIDTDGTSLVVANADGVRIVGRGALLAQNVVAFAVVREAVWIVEAAQDGHALHRFSMAGDALGTTALGDLGDGVEIQATRSGARVALIEGGRAVLVRETAARVAVDRIGERARDRRILLGQRGVLERVAGALVAVRGHGLRPLDLPADLFAAAVCSGASVFDGAAAIVEIALGGHRAVLMYDLRSGLLLSRIRIGKAAIAAVAERSGRIAMRDVHRLAVFDLRARRCVAEAELAPTAHELAIDGAGATIVVLDRDGEASILDVNAESVGAEPEAHAAAECIAEPAPDCAAELLLAPAPLDTADLVSASDLRASVALESEGWPASAELLALAPRAPTAELDDEDRHDYLEAARSLAFAWCRTAAAVAEGAGRLHPRSTSTADGILAILDGKTVTAPAIDLLAARIAENEAQAAFRAWQRPDAPHVVLQHELGLSATAMVILWAVAAPQLWGELAAAYALLRGGRGPTVDEVLLGQLLELTGPDRSLLSLELEPSAPLIAHGLIVVGHGERPFAEIRVSRAAVLRLAGAAMQSPNACTFDELIATPGAIRRLVDDLRTGGDGPARIVVRGRRGSGRRTLARALGAYVGRPAMMLDVRAPIEDERDLARELAEIHVAGGLACVTLEHGGDEDAGALARIGAILDRHPGPLVVRVRRAVVVPIAPGHHTVELGGLDAAGRRVMWSAALCACDADPAPASLLASRFDVGAGVARRVVETMVARAEPLDVATVERHLRRQRAARLETLATLIPPKATWNDLVLPPEMLDSLRELVARVSLRGRVLDDWGMHKLAGGARGVTALFQGGPGTGKTLAATVVAGALGHELYRVDLSRLVSKWIGETEKNLAELFDAAEDGECVLLFDEADSLFARRTDVKSSHDRNANLEVNYLLQRLDTFTGIAILTTNFGTSIDPAFKRRMSAHLQFPFPDADERERLWRAHVPPMLPIAGVLDFGALAGSQLSGGYIRNATLRAAYLAAVEDKPLAMDHLMRAVRLEYRDRAKLTEGGRLE